MTCDVCAGLLATGTANAPEWSAVDAHVAGCATCRQAREAFARVDRATAADSSWTPPTNFAYRVGAQAAEMLAARALSVYGVTPRMAHVTTTAILWLVGLLMAGRVLSPTLVAAASDADVRLGVLMAGSISMSLWLRWKLRWT
jgi:hypothetical protein